MEELLELKELLINGEVESALLLVGDLEEMGKKGVARNIRSYAKVLLLHLVKQQAEKRTTKSWDTSIRNAVREIKDVNARPKSKGTYLSDEELYETISAARDSAIDEAAIQCCEGAYEAWQIKEMVDENELIEKAYGMVK